MEIVYDLIQENPKYFAWTFGVVNLLWGVFVFFNKQSHDKAMAILNYSLRLEQEESLPLIKRILELEEVAGEVKEIVTSYKPVNQKRDLCFPIFEKLDKLAGQFSKYPQLMQSIRDLKQHCVIMIQGTPHDSCRDDVLNFYNSLINESEHMKYHIKVRK